jgi:signal transduction histidine kinase
MMFRLSIKTKLSAIIGLLVLSFIAFSVGYYPRRMEDQLRNQARESAKQIAETAGNALAPALRKGSREDLANVLNAVKNMPTFGFCAVYDDQGVAVDSTPSTPEWVAARAKGAVTADAFSLPDRNLILAMAPVFYRDALSKSNGVLVIAFTTEELQKAVSDNIRTSLWAGLLTLALGVGAAVYLSNKYIRPVLQLTGAAQQVAHGNLDTVSLAVNSRDELEDLSRAFDMMTNRLRVSRDEIERQNRLLEFRVQERTRQLMETIWELEEIRANLEQLVQERTRGLEQSREELKAWAETLEEKVWEKTQELRALHENVLESYQKLQLSDRLKDEFLANMSHELRTPLNAIIGFSGMLMQDDAGKVHHEAREDLQIIFQNGRSLLGLIDSILDLSKIQAGKMELELEHLDPLPILDEVMSLAQGLVGNRPVQLRYQRPERLVLVKADPARLRQVFTNLVGNALKFTEGGYVRILPVVAGPSLRVEIEDTGIGMTEEEVGRLFVPFRQVDGSITRRFGGTGLGLALSQQFMGLMGGHISVTSRKGQGSSFVIQLPVLQVTAR